MKVQEFMTESPRLCTPATTLHDVAGMMSESDCGAIPVVESLKNKKLVGIITDRDIACWAVGHGFDPDKAKVEDFMSKHVVTITSQHSLDDCSRIMRERQLRRLVVVEAHGQCTGIVSQAQVARHSTNEEAGELLKGISKPSKVAAAH